jgi:hypothetical protein
MVNKSKLVVPAALTVGYLYYILSTPADFDMTNYALGLLVIFALAAKAISDDTDKYFVLVGYLFWNLAYVWQIYYGFKEQKSSWPLFTGAYYVVNEFITCCTNIYESHGSENGRYVTPLYVRMGYYIFFALDLFLNMMTIYLGTGSATDELGVFPMNTMEQRALGFVSWCAFWMFTQYQLAQTFGPRQAKYSMAAFQYVCQLSTLRLPVFRQIHSHIGLANAMKFQTFGSAFYVVRIKAPCEPQILFRTLLFFMSPFCALTATSLFPLITDGLSTETFGILTCIWLVSFWVVLVGIQRYSRAKEVLPLDQNTTLEKPLLNGTEPERIKAQ